MDGDDGTDPYDENLKCAICEVQTKDVDPVGKVGIIVRVE